VNPGIDTGVVTLTAEEAAGQSLARGTAGTALLHIERALTGSGSWETAQSHIQRAAAGPVDAAEHAGLYYGAPAIAFMLHTAPSCCTPRQTDILGTARSPLRWTSTCCVWPVGV